MTIPDPSSSIFGNSHCLCTLFLFCLCRSVGLENTLLDLIPPTVLLLIVTSPAEMGERRVSVVHTAVVSLATILEFWVWALGLASMGILVDRIVKGRHRVGAMGSHLGILAVGMGIMGDRTAKGGCRMGAGGSCVRILAP
jgi:hypothetical protein